MTPGTNADGGATGGDTGSGSYVNAPISSVAADHKRDDGTAHVTRLVGGPGSGKSTLLRQFVRREREEFGTSISDMLISTFTRAARADMTDAMKGEFPDIDEGDIDNSVRTLHSAALQACKDDGALRLRSRDRPEAPGKLLIQNGNSDGDKFFTYFFRSKFPQVKFDPGAGDPIRALETGESTEPPTGNRVMSVYNHLRSKDWPLDWHYHTPVDVDLPDPLILQILRAWDDYKDRNDLIEHDDYVKLAVDTNALPDARVLFIDEFQDLSPLQHRLYEQWRDSGAIDRIYIAGDLHQAIYGFRGAEPAYFRDTRADRTIHKELSYRCRKAIIGGAKPIAQAIPEHDVHRVGAHNDGGVYEHISADDADELGAAVAERVDQHGEVFLLARTNRQVAKLAYGLREAGQPYYDLKGDNGWYKSWADPLPAILAVLQAFGHGDPIPHEAAERLLATVTRSPRRRDAVIAAENGQLATYLAGSPGFRTGWVGAGQYRGWFAPDTRPRDIVSMLTVDTWQRELLDAAIASRATHDPEDVQIGTIHAAKGLEVPCTLLFPAYSQKQLSRYEGGDTTAEEHRVYYVAMTRASHHLSVVHDYFGGEEFPPLAG